MIIRFFPKLNRKIIPINEVIVYKKRSYTKKNNNKEANKDNGTIKKKRKETIPKALREQVWIKYIGTKFASKCYVSWCKNQITCFNFDCGHNIPESKGGKLILDNLRPICRNCNISMGANFTIDEWIHKFKPEKKKKKWFFF